MRILIRIVFVIFAAALLAIGAGLAWFGSWRADRVANLNAASALAETSLGAVEYVQTGEGPAVLVFHGTPGGYDQAMLFGSSLAEGGFQIVAPSRSGYLRTPLASGISFEEQAAAMADLLDSLHIESVAVLGVSGGAPAAVQFALKYPKRTWALALVSPVLKRLPTHEKEALPEELNRELTGDIGCWMILQTAERNPAKALGWAFDLTQSGDETSREIWTRAVLSSPEQLGWFRDLVGTFCPSSPREAGLRNDMVQLHALNDLPFHQITAPVLFIHGDQDSFIPAADIQAVAAKIPGAEIFPVAETGHIVPLGPHAGDVAKRLADFLRQHSGGQGTP